MTPEEMGARARQLMQQGFHCSQAVLTAGQEKLELDQPDVRRALGLFGGGFTGSGKTCGILAGAIACISSVYSRADLESRENPAMWKLGHMVDDEFVRLTAGFGGPNCADIARVDWQNRDQVREFYKDPESRRQHCLGLIEQFAAYLGRVIEEEKVVRPD